MAGSYNELMGIGVHSEDANMEGWWLLQDNAASTAVVDQSSNGRNGVLQGGNNTQDLATTGPNSWLTSGLHLDGSADFISVASVPEALAGSYVVLIRANPDAVSATQSAVSHGNHFSFDEGLSIFVETSVVYARCDASNDNSERASQHVAMDATWRSLGLQIDRTGSVILGYKDGSNSGWMNGGGGPSSNSISGFSSISIGSTFRIGIGGDGSSFPFDGILAECAVLSRLLSAAEHANWHAGPELNYSSGVSWASDGTFDVGTWALPSPFAAGSNGAASYEVVAALANGTIVDGGTGGTGTLDLSGVAGQTVYLLVRATNSGGYDIGDEASRTSSYGSAGDGYYELASVTAASSGISPSGISSNEAFGTAALTQSIASAGIASAEAFGSAGIITSQQISPSGISSAESFGSHQVSTGAGPVNVRFDLPARRSIEFAMNCRRSISL